MSSTKAEIRKKLRKCEADITTAREKKNLELKIKLQAEHRELSLELAAAPENIVEKEPEKKIIKEKITKNKDD